MDNKVGVCKTTSFVDEFSVTKPVSQFTWTTISSDIRLFSTWCGLCSIED